MLAILDFLGKFFVYKNLQFWTIFLRYKKRVNEKRIDSFNRQYPIINNLDLHNE